MCSSQPWLQLYFFKLACRNKSLLKVYLCAWVTEKQVLTRTNLPWKGRSNKIIVIHFHKRFFQSSGLWSASARKKTFFNVHMPTWLLLGEFPFTSNWTLVPLYRLSLFPWRHMNSVLHSNIPSEPPCKITNLTPEWLIRAPLETKCQDVSQLTDFWASFTAHRVHTQPVLRTVVHTAIQRRMDGNGWRVSIGRFLLYKAFTKQFHQINVNSEGKNSKYLPLKWWWLICLWKSGVSVKRWGCLQVWIHFTEAWWPNMWHHSYWQNRSRDHQLLHCQQGYNSGLVTPGDGLANRLLISPLRTVSIM